MMIFHYLDCCKWLQFWHANDQTAVVFFADKLFIIHLSVSGLSGGYLPHLYFTVQYNIHHYSHLHFSE